MSEDIRADILAEMALSRSIVEGGADVVPRFRIFCPDGEETVFVALPEAVEDRMKRLDAVKSFMIWKAASRFLLSSELVSPNLILTASVARDGVLGATQEIKRDPIRFGRVQWLSPESLGDEIVGLLPPKSVSISQSELDFMSRAFVRGEVEGIHWKGPGG